MGQDAMQVELRAASERDVAAMAEIRARNSHDVRFWHTRIAGYLKGDHSPQKALRARAIFVAVQDGGVIGFVAGHRTTRYECDGELQWIDVREESRGRGTAGRLLALMAKWFIEQNAFRTCVNVDPDNAAARNLYARFGAEPLNDFWMVWPDVRMIAAAP